MALALEARAMAEDILIGDTPKAVRRRKRLKLIEARGRIWKHSRLRDIDGASGIGALDEFFVFTMVRDPWTRVFSLYHWLRAQNFDHPVVPKAKGLEFGPFLQDPIVSDMLSRDAVDQYVTDNSGKNYCNTFVRLEHFREDIVPVETHLGFKLGVLPHANGSDRPTNVRGAYDARSAEQVRAWFATDIERFGYEF